MAGALVRLENVTRLYSTGHIETSAIENVSLTLGKGEYLSITGQSGSGKSTLLSIMALVDRPTSGAIWFDGVNTSESSARDLAEIRAKDIGVVFQAFHLIPELTVRENVELRLKYCGEKATRQRRTLADEALTLVGLSNRLDHYPDQLSGGQQQRVAIARAIAGKPKVIFADEPTGNLDSQTSGQIMDLFQKISEAGIAILLVTHDTNFAKHASRTINLRDGLVVS